MKSRFEQYLEASKKKSEREVTGAGMGPGGAPARGSQRRTGEEETVYCTSCGKKYKNKQAGETCPKPGCGGLLVNY